MRVLADMHHGDLYESLRILVEDRLGWKLYRPVGVDWYTEGLWKVYDHPATVQQYLGLDGLPPMDVHGNDAVEVFGEQAWVNGRLVDRPTDGEHLYTTHTHGGKLHRAVELWRAKEQGFDLLISSLPQHFAPYEQFRRQYCPRAKHVFQMGNVNWQVPDGVQNLLNSTALVPPGSLHHVRYHQEFSLEEFAYRPCPNPRSLANLMHFHQGHYEQQFNSVRGWLELQGWTVKDYGAGNPDGPVNNVAEVIQQTGFIWHCKKGGDGYGHNIHNAFACGRPMVVSRSQHNGQIADTLFTPTTVFDLDRYTPQLLAGVLEVAAANHSWWADHVYSQFKWTVDFDQEFTQIQSFLDNLR